MPWYCKDEPDCWYEYQRKRITAKWNYIREIRDKFNLTVLILEHHMDLIMGVCDRIFVLNFGISLAQGTPMEIQGDKRVIEAYLGKEEENYAEGK